MVVGPSSVEGSVGLDSPPEGRAFLPEPQIWIGRGCLL